MYREDPKTRDGRLSRRELLQVGAAGAAAAALADLPAAAEPGRERNLIFILCTGGPSQLDTWDPKPDAPASVRGPYDAIRTRVPGARFAETLPRLAKLADRFAVVRSVHHDGPALHEIGMQLAHTGQAFGTGAERPHYGAVLAHLRGSRKDAAPYVVLPRPVGFAGVPLPHGQHAGFLGPRLDPVVAAGDPNSAEGMAAETYRGAAETRVAATPAFRTQLASFGPAPTLVESPSIGQAFDPSGEADRVRDRYGRSAFGQSCLTARRLIESGTRCVTLNQFGTIFNAPSWDSHGYPDLPTRVADLKEQVALPFDRAVSALIEDLSERGLYEDTLICCFGEFGRTPEITKTGGRDHWTRCWSVMLGGGGIRGGQVVGASDSRGAEPTERPVTPAELAATVYTALGVPLSTRLPLPDGSHQRLLEPGVRAIAELL